MGVGSGDAGREEAVETDAAPPEMRNGAQERLGLGLGAGAGVGLGAGTGTGSGGVSCRERESRRRPDACEGVGEVSPGEGRRGLCPDLRWLL